MEVLNGMAEKGSEHVKYLHDLLISLHPATGPSKPEEETSPTIYNMIDQEAPVSDPEGSSSTVPPQPAAHAPDGVFQAMDELLLREGMSIDANFWEEGYGNYDLNMIWQEDYGTYDMTMI